jgi:hypothetical protein
VEAERGLGECSVRPEAQQGQRAVEPGVDDVAPVARAGQAPPVEILDERVALDDESVVVDETVAEVVRVGEKRGGKNENGRARDVASPAGPG